VRPYRPRDPVRHLHARTWARTGQPHVREFQEELFSRVAVVIDDDAGDDDRFEAVVSLAAGLLAQLARGEVIVDLLAVGDALHTLSVGRGPGVLPRALDALAVAEPGPPLDPAARLARVGPYLEPLSVLFLVCGRWDPRRAALAAGLAAGGLPVKSYVVDGGEGPFRAVTTAAIESGEPLAL
jgi:uncharacterized protein (DUF58 family)